MKLSGFGLLRLALVALFVSSTSHHLLQRAETYPTNHLSLPANWNRFFLTMFEPVRGGTRGGQAEFKWSDVSADKDREVRLVFQTCDWMTEYAMIELPGT